MERGGVNQRNPYGGSRPGTPVQKRPVVTPSPDAKSNDGGK
jgi:hypothetical protein